MEVFEAVLPRAFNEKFLVHGVRTDGRAPHERRACKLTAGSITTAAGSAFVTAGNTAVVCAVKAKVGNTRGDDFPLVFNVELNALCSPSFGHGAPSKRAQTACQFVNSVLSTCGVLDPRSLVITADGASPPAAGDRRERLSWYLYIDAYCLDFDGNILDASMVAALAALRNVTLPRAHLNAAGELVLSTDAGQRRPLALKTLPLPCSFGKLGTHVLADTTASEEALLDGTLRIVSCVPVDADAPSAGAKGKRKRKGGNDDDGDTAAAVMVTRVHKTGHAHMTSDERDACMLLARTYARDTARLILK